MSIWVGLLCVVGSGVLAFAVWTTHFLVMHEPPDAEHHPWGLKLAMWVWAILVYGSVAVLVKGVLGFFSDAGIHLGEGAPVATMTLPFVVAFVFGLYWYEEGQRDQRHEFHQSVRYAAILGFEDSYEVYYPLTGCWHDEAFATADEARRFLVSAGYVPTGRRSLWVGAGFHGPKLPDHIDRNMLWPKEYAQLRSGTSFNEDVAFYARQVVSILRDTGTA